MGLPGMYFTVEIFPLNVQKDITKLTTNPISLDERKVLADFMEHNREITKNFGDYSGSSCREILLSTITGKINRFAPIFCNGSSYLNLVNTSSETIVRKYKTGIHIKICMSTPNWAIAAAYKYTGYSETMVQVTVSERYTYVYMNDWSYYDVSKLSMFLFILNRSDDLTEKDVESGDTLIKWILAHPKLSFPNNLESARLYSFAQGFAIWSNTHTNFGMTGRSPDFRSTYVSYNNGVANCYLELSRRHPEDFVRYLKEYNIDPAEVEKLHRFSGGKFGWPELYKLVSDSKEEVKAW